MLFGSISYLNLLPFQVFLKRHIKSNAQKMSLRFKRAVPSQINKALRRKKIHAAFISSVASSKYKCTNLGIIAHQKVYSVLLLKGANQSDPASATSNQLARVLGLEGKVVIGDQALTYYLQGVEGIDLAEAWHEKTGLPFVFARLCYNSHDKAVQKLAKGFSHTNVKIPQYILKKEANKRGITPQQLTWYLSHIHYNMDYRAKKSLTLFLNQSKKLPKS